MSGFYFEVGTWDKYYSEVKDLVFKSQELVNPPGMPPLTPDEDLYGQLGAAGLNTVIVLKDLETEEIKGYTSSTLFKHPQYKGYSFALVDVLHICQEYKTRERKAARELLKITEKYLKDVKSVEYVLFGTSVNMNIGKWLERQGYKPLEISYMKRI